MSSTEPKINGGQEAVLGRSELRPTSATADVWRGHRGRRRQVGPANVPTCSLRKDSKYIINESLGRRRRHATAPLTFYHAPRVNLRLPSLTVPGEAPPVVWSPILLRKFSKISLDLLVDHAAFY